MYKLLYAIHERLERHLSRKVGRWQIARQEGRGYEWPNSWAFKLASRIEFRLRNHLMEHHRRQVAERVARNAKV